MSGTAHKAAAPSAFDVVILAASLGGPAALSAVIGRLPADFPAAIFVVQHRTPDLGSVFTDALRRRTALPVRSATDGQPISAPGVTVLPARQTAVFQDGCLRLRAADDFRCADGLMRSVAAAYGPRTITAVLTGRLDDGAAGTRVVKQHGGRTLAEDPRTARAPGMPAAALATGCVDLVLPLSYLAHGLVALTMAPGAADLFQVPPAPWAHFAA